MRKIVVQMMLSLDGYFEGPDHEFAGIWRAMPKIVYFPARCRRSDLTHRCEQRWTPTKSTCSSSSLAET
jgi:hypothetical protein